MTPDLSARIEQGREYIFTPDRSSALYIDYVEHMLNSRSLSYGCSSLDNRCMTPQKPGQITVLVARPGMGKTSLLVYFARHIGQMCDVSKGECVIYVTWEESIEAIETRIQSKSYTSEHFAFDPVDMAIVRREATSRVNLPVIMVGKSLMQQRKQALPPLTIPKLRDAILSLHYDLGLKPALIIGDYVQKIPKADTRQSRSDDIAESMFALSDLAVEVKAPIMLGAQATREVDQQRMPIPTLSGVQWTSAIEQEAHRMIGIVRPANLEKQNGQPWRSFEIGSTEYAVSENVLIWKILKQRDYSPKQKKHALYFNPATFQLGDLAPAKSQSPNGTYTYVR